MTLHFWPLVVLALAVLAYGAWRWRRLDPRRTPLPDGLPAANTARLREAPRYRALAANALRWSLVTVVSSALLVAGSILLVGRLADANQTRDTMHNRDIMLCLDVSGSMQEADVEMLRAFGRVVSQMRGERVGLTIWNNTSVSLFPLTDDYDFLQRQIDEAAARLEKSDYDFMQGTIAGRGASLIGDGLASCVQRFDRLDEPRSRSVILATDNELSGAPVFRLREAVDLAVKRKVLVHGIAPDESREVAAMRQELARTGGQTYLLPGVGAGPGIVASIEATEARRLDGLGGARVTDLPLPGLLLCTLGALGLALAGPVRRLSSRSPKRPEVAS